MKSSKTAAESVSMRSSFPHRGFKKELPKISQKIVPVHLLEIRQMYQGKMSDLLVPDQWAYVPIQGHKKSSYFQRSHTEANEGSEVRMTTSNSSAEKFRSTSEIFLKKYLKRKQRKQVREAGNITNYMGTEQQQRGENSGFLESIIRLKTSKLEKYRSDSIAVDRDRRLRPSKSRTKEREELQDFKSEKVDLKEKLRVYETNIKNKKFQIKMGDRRYKHIQHSFQNIQC